MHEPDSRGATAEASRERLIDRITLSALLAQLRLQPLQPGYQKRDALLNDAAPRNTP